jgi:hypothetical protein
LILPDRTIAIGARVNAANPRMAPQGDALARDLPRAPRPPWARLT